MISNRNKVLGIGGLALAGVVAVVLVNSAFAQGGQGGGQAGGFAGGQGGQGGRGMMFQPMGMGGPSAMIGDEKNVYILQGNRLFKVKKSDLSIEAEKQIGGVRPPQGGGPGNMPPLE